MLQLSFCYYFVYFQLARSRERFAWWSIGVGFHERVALCPGFEVFHRLPVRYNDVVVGFDRFQYFGSDKAGVAGDCPFPIFPALFECLLMSFRDWDSIRNYDGHGW